MKKFVAFEKKKNCRNRAKATEPGPAACRLFTPSGRVSSHQELKSIAEHDRHGVIHDGASSSLVANHRVFHALAFRGQLFQSERDLDFNLHRVPGIGHHPVGVACPGSHEVLDPFNAGQGRVVVPDKGQKGLVLVIRGVCQLVVESQREDERVRHFLAVGRFRGSSNDADNIRKDFVRSLAAPSLG